MKSISAKELSNLLISGASIDLIDVRTPPEFRALHIAIARNQPLDQLDPTVIQAARQGSSSGPLYVVCRSGGRSRQACEKLLAAGITDVINVEGGTMACEAAGVPVVRGKKTISVIGQVQIITGLTVLAGAIIAIATGNLYWLSLPIVMGSGLVLSGLTDTCAMGTILARMPWNQTKPDVRPSTATTPSKSCSTSVPGCCH